MEQFQVIIIGSGPGGYVAAIRAGLNGLKTALVEKDPFLGGTCLHKGCIPTKALLHTAELYEDFNNATELGIKASGISLDFPAVHLRKRSVVDKLAQGIRILTKKHKVSVFEGAGSLTDNHTVRVQANSGQTEIRGDSIVLATGSRPMSLPHIQPDGKTIINSDHILELESVPQSLAVVGSGAVGVEFASIFRSFGSDVHLIELLPQLLPLEDEDCGKMLGAALRRKGIRTYVGTEVTGVTLQDRGATLNLVKKDKESTLDVERVLVATGRSPVTTGLNLDSIGVAMDGRFVKVDEYMRSSVPDIYAIGDIVATPQLAHVASAEGILAVDHIAGRHVHPVDYGQVPSCTYSRPEVASVGISERKAIESGYDVKVGKFPFAAIGKAVIVDEPFGFVKIVSESQSDRVLGVHIVGPRATELIAEACLGMKLKTTVADIAHTIHAHPTLSETMMEAAHSVYHEAIHA